MAPLLSLLHLFPMLLATRRRCLRPQQLSLQARSSLSTDYATNPLTPTQPELVHYQVCLSPGCVADGAYDTLERMQALAPPHVVVEAGTCHSLCGNGPVVNQQKQQHRKVMGNDRVLQLLYAPPTAAAAVEDGDLQQVDVTSNPTTEDLDDDDDDDDDELLNMPINPLNDVQAMQRSRRLEEKQQQKKSKSKSAKSKSKLKNLYTEPPATLVQGYNLVLEADALMDNQNYERALELYQQAVNQAFGVAMEFQRQRELLHHPGSSSSSSSATRRQPPAALAWLIRARRNQAVCQLNLLDEEKTKQEVGVDGVNISTKSKSKYCLEDAMLAAQAACNLSRNTCIDSFQVLADIYQRKGDLRGELQALQSILFATTVDETTAATAAAGRQDVSLKSLSTKAQNQKRLWKFRVEKIERLLKQLDNSDSNNKGSSTSSMLNSKNGKNKKDPKK